MTNFTATLLDFFNFMESKFFVYYILFQYFVPQRILTREERLLYVELYTNRQQYLHMFSFDILKGWPMYRFDIFYLLELMDVTSDQYINLPEFLMMENLQNTYVFLIFKFFFVTWLKIWYGSFILLLLIKTIIIDHFKIMELFNLDQVLLEFEHNVGNGEDLLAVISGFLALIAAGLCFWFFRATTVEFHIVLFLLCLTFVIIPIRIVISFGILAINYIRGGSKFPILFKEQLYDFLLLLIFCVRFSLQSVRIILIYIFYFSIHEYIFILPQKYFFNLEKKHSIYCRTLFSHIFGMLRWLFELADSTVSIANQFCSFFFVIFWLFSYINTFELKKRKIVWYGNIKTIKIIINFTNETHPLSKNKFFFIKTSK